VLRGLKGDIDRLFKKSARASQKSQEIFSVIFVNS
jgi:hypothetical protein